MKIFWLIVIAVLTAVIYRISRSYRGNSQKASQERAKPHQGTIHAGAASLEYEVSVREKTASEERSRELLRDATQKKDEKNLDGAIASLREAYKLMAQSTISYPIETFLRLPLYLQQAGRYAESIQEFERLLSNTPAQIARAFSHVSEEKRIGFVAVERATIFDKMRLAAQREKQFVIAAYYQVLSDANRCISLKLHEGTEEVDRYNERESWIDGIDSLLKKAKKEIFIEPLVGRCMAFAQLSTAPALDKLAIEVPTLLEINSILSIGGRSLAENKATQESYSRSDEYLQWLGEAVHLHITQARKAWDAGNYDFARQEYQKTAYAITQIERAQLGSDSIKS